jgi:PAS domain S-box-containing protein
MSVQPCDRPGATYAVIAQCSIPRQGTRCRSLPRRAGGLERIINSVPHALWTADRDGRVGYFNAAWSKLTGAGAGANIETVLFNMIHECDRHQWRARWRDAVESGQPYEVEYRLGSGTGKATHWYLERGAPLRATAARGACRWVMTATCIDEDKHREEELRRMVALRDEFFATLVHELRNPLAPITSALDVLGGCKNDELGITFARGILQRQVRQLTRLVDDLLDISRIARGGVELQCQLVDLSEVLCTAIEAARPTIESREHELTAYTPGPPIVLEADAVRLAQVLTNLLINAAKYTPARGHISLRSIQEGNVARITVTDDGIGIAREKLAEIFDLFAQVEPGSPASRSGLGVGLAVARKLVLLHGGTISVSSGGLGCGSEFTIRLPVTRAAGQRSAERAPDELR